MNRSVGHGCRFGFVTDNDGEVIFECPVYCGDTRCPVDDCPAHDDVRYCPICGRDRPGCRVGTKAILVCRNGHTIKIRMTEWVERLAEVKTA